MSRQRDLWRYLLRVVALRPILAGLAGAGLMALGGFRSAMEQSFAAVLVAASASAVLDDPAMPVLAASPSPLWWRRVTRLVLGVPATAAAWVAVVATARLLGEVSSPVNVEVATMTAVALAAASVVIRRTTDGVGALAGPPLVLLVAMSTFVLPERWDLYPVSAHQFRWWLLSLAAISVLIACSRDPAARPLLARTHGYGR